MSYQISVSDHSSYLTPLDYINPNKEYIKGIGVGIGDHIHFLVLSSTVYRLFF